MKNFDFITPNKENLLICFFLCLALGLYADEKIDSIKAKEVPVVSDTVLRSIQYPTNALILPGVVVFGNYPNKHHFLCIPQILETNMKAERDPFKER